MKICLLGSNLTNLILAYQISKKKLPIDIYCSAFPSVPNTSRTIAISNENFHYLNPKNTFKFKYWPSKAIKIYNDKNTKSEKGKNLVILDTIRHASKTVDKFYFKLLCERYNKLIR